MAKRDGDWVPCLDWGGTGFSLIGDPFVGLLVAARDVLGVGTGLVGVMEHGQAVWVDRVVGQVELVLASEDQALVIERVVVGILDDDNNFALFADAYTDATQANEPFLWQRVSRMTLTGESNLGPAGVAHPWWGCIDIRVGRRLNRQEALFYVCEVSGSVAGQVRVIPFLRSWVVDVGR